MVTGQREIRKQQPGNRLLNMAGIGLAAFYTSCLVYIFFFARRRWMPLPERNFNLVPFREKILYLRSYGTHTHLQNVEFYKDLIGNIFLFIPFPILLFYVVGIKSYRKLALISVCTSLTIEIIQITLNIGVADIDDLVLNTVGSSIGLLILYALSRPKINYYGQSMTT
jgi:glycopeptide antibiotics resistance protein